MYKVWEEIAEGFNTKWEVAEYATFRDAYIAYYRRYNNPRFKRLRKVVLVDCTVYSKVLFEHYM